MDPTYFLLLIFVPVPVMLLYAIIVDIYDRKKQSKLLWPQMTVGLPQTYSRSGSGLTAKL